MRNMIELMQKIITTKLITMNNTFLEKQIDDAKNDINYVIEQLLEEIHEIEKSNEKLEDMIDNLENEINNLRVRILELETELNDIINYEK